MSEQVVFHRHEIKNDRAGISAGQLFGIFEIRTGSSKTFVPLYKLLDALSQDELKMLSERINRMIKWGKGK